MLLTCLNCKHIAFDPSRRGTDVTPGNDARLSCEKGHFRREVGLNLIDYFVLKGEICPDLELNSDVEGNRRCQTDSSTDRP